MMLLCSSSPFQTTRRVWVAAGLCLIVLTMTSTPKTSHTLLPVVHAFEGDEEPCPAFANLTDGDAFPTCLLCVENDCGYAVDEGDCVKDCATVNDTECFSLSANPDAADADAVCALAAEASGGDNNGTTSPPEEEMCAAFETSGETPTCETCLEAGCGWTADDGDCLKDCGEVNDGATCLSPPTDGGNVTSVCEGGGMPEEEMCAAFEASGKTPTCETCLEAGCGWTEDDGDCLKDCLEVNDGAKCLMASSGAAADVCGSSSGGTGGSGGSGSTPTKAPTTSGATGGISAVAPALVSLAAALFL